MVRAALPSLLTVIKEAATPRLPTLSGKKRARTTTIAVYGAADLDANVQYLGLKGSPTKVSKIFYPKVTRSGRVLRASDEESIDQAVDELMNFLEERDLLERI
jgi:electron transfer flavoprotein beta subunit